MAKVPFNILCIGDSLTAGSPSLHPYALKLKEKLEGALPHYDVECDVQGREGDQVTQGGFDKRLETSWAVADRPFDWTIVLGGSNDLTWNKKAEDVIAALENTWDIALTEGGRVLAMTVPEYRAKIQRINDRRDEVNKAIMAHSHPRFYTLDLHKAIPYHAMSDEDRERYWDSDGVHLTAAGYDLMGEKVAEGLIRIIKSIS
ncbi:Uu.00g112620.m01.CDS01 [Anthostomella pinea]|uniref:Uu.00g112620.m01.CDS01 n=1 Tax=Anthostomella pinea TaxID=933095 RepID=A0AAI8YE22_9PEZI|nr:Uu.00g112620.m01.CDS01 [Anthostomella pinea]